MTGFPLSRATRRGLALLAASALTLPLASCGTPPKNAAIPIPGPVSASGGLRVQTRNQDGSQVQLGDGSRWMVQPAGRSASVHWSPGFPLNVHRTGQSDWPFVLVDPSSGVMALVRPG